VGANDIQQIGNYFSQGVGKQVVVYAAEAVVLATHVGALLRCWCQVCCCWA
jgi:hypothetical protein